MGRLLRIVLGAVTVLAVLAYLGFAYYTAREEVPEVSTYELDLDAVRQLAAALPGERPSAVHSLLVARRALPRGAIFAGEGFEDHAMLDQVFQLPRPDGSFLLIDTAVGAEMQEQMSGDLDEAAQAALQGAIGAAATIVITHEHGDHLDGVARYASPDDLVGRLLLNEAQLGNEKRLREVDFPESLAAKLEPLALDPYRAIAPGVVLIAAPGHTPGSQIIYVGLADGRELLFLGDVVWHMDMIRDLHYRPRLTTDLFLGEDRAAVLHQIRRLSDLRKSDPEVAQIVSHDSDQRAALVASGLIRDGLQAGM